MIARPDTILRTQLEKRFAGWCLAHGADVDSAAVLTEAICERYEETQRHYHHLGHIAGSLSELDLHAPGDPLIEGAIWFHDVIYDPKRGDNEAASIAWFQEETRGWLDPGASLEICRLIEATDFRTTPDETPKVALMIDIDLAILSETAAEYDAYARAIHLEYAHVPEEDFRKGRAKVMEHFLSRQIYRTAGFLPREERARKNIKRELGRLA